MSDALSDISSLEPITTEQHHMHKLLVQAPLVDSDYDDGMSPHAFVIASQLMTMGVAQFYPRSPFPPIPFFRFNGSPPADIDSLACFLKIFDSLPTKVRRSARTEKYFPFIMG